jgi:hypothetical protein
MRDTRHGSSTEVAMSLRTLSRTRVALGIAALGVSAVLSAQPAEKPKAACTPNGNTLCLNNGRFSVTATYQSTPSGPSNPANAVSLTDDTGYFWFFDPTNTEMVIKVLNGCAINTNYWVFLAGLTSVGVTTTVQDLQSGTMKTYTNPVNTAFQPKQDTSAFPTCP